MCKWICCLAAVIGIASCGGRSNQLRATEPPSNREKWLFLLDQVRSHSARLKAGECAIAGRMYSPPRQKTIAIDHPFAIRLAFVRPLKCR
jgi:hypothetical protein